MKRNPFVVLGIGVLLLVALTGLFATRSLPGGLLYGIKIGLYENIESSFTGSGRDRADWQLAVAARRLDEAARAAAKGKLDSEAQATVLLNFNKQMKGIEDYIAQLREEEKNTEIKELAVKIGQTLAAKAEILSAVREELHAKEDIQTQGSLDFLLLRVANTVAGAANIAASTLIEEPAPDTSGLPKTDEWGNPL